MGLVWLECAPALLALAVVGVESCELADDVVDTASVSGRSQVSGK